MTKLLKIYGERHSGAVFLASLLRRLPGVTETPSGAHREEAAKRMRTLLAGVSGPVSPQTRRAVREAIVDDLTEADGPTGAWRHAAARFHSDFATGDISVIFVVPSPWAWLESVWRRPYHRLGPPVASFPDFVTSPWVTVRREFAPSVVANPAALWNRKVGSYLKFTRAADEENVRCLFVRSEDLLLRRKATLVGIGEWIGAAGVVDVLSAADEGAWEGYRRRYEQGLWRSRFDAASRAFVEGALAEDLTSRFGYDPPS